MFSPFFFPGIKIPNKESQFGKQGNKFKINNYIKTNNNYEFYKTTFAMIYLI